MDTVSVRELRNHGGEVISRVALGEAVIITRDGTEIAELRALPRRTPSTAELIARRASLPDMDAAALRADLDAALDPSL